MQKQEKPKKRNIEIEITGSETILEKIKRKTPWIFGKKIRKPKINFPKIRFRRISFPIPPRILSLITIFIILFLLQTGIVYLIVRKPLALGVNDKLEPILVFPDEIHELLLQFLFI